MNVKWLPGAFGLAAFVVFASFVPPGPYWLDSQELGAAAVRMGSPHPTGFPLFCLLGQVASWLPLGELAWRLHLVSASCAAVAVGLTCALTLGLAGRDRVGLVAGVTAPLLLAASATFFRAATVTEVYAPTAALLALTLWLLRRVAVHGSPRDGLVLAWIAGIGAVGVHASFRLLLFVPIVVVLIPHLRAGRRWVLLAPGVAVGGALLMLLYLPLRSASGHAAVLDWGHPRHLGALWDHAFAAARIRAAYADEMLSTQGADVWRHVEGFAGQLEVDLGALALVAALAGALHALVALRPRLIGWSLVWIAAGDAIYAVWLNPMGLAERQNGVPFAVAAAILAGLGLGVAARRFGRGAVFAGAAMAAMVVIPALIADGPARLAVARSDAPRAFAEAALEAAPPRAVLLTQSDSLSAGLVWQSHVEGARPDAAVLVRQHMWDQPLVAAVLARARRADTRGATLWEMGVDALDRPPGYGAPMAVLDGADDPSAAARLARVFAGRADDDENGRRAHAGALVGLGRQAMWRRDLPAAKTHFRAAADVDPSSPAPLVNLGVVAGLLGEPALAAQLSEAALALSPDHLTARINAARYRMGVNDDAAAARHAARALQLDPRSADALGILGTLAARARRFDEARAYFERALALDPEQVEARVNLPKLRKAH